MFQTRLNRGRDPRATPFFGRESDGLRVDRPTRIALCAGVGVVAAGGFLALTVSPLRYGTAESVLLVCVFAAVALFETVLGDASF